MSLAAIAAQPASLRLALLTVCLGSLLGPLDTAVNVAFPRITQAFGLQIADIQWIVAAYIIAQGGLTLAFGQLGDLYGHRRIFRLGMAACALAHLMCALAPSYGWLVAARVAQGVAVGLAMACGPAIATLLYPPELRRTILSLYVMLFATGVAIGPLLGGLMMQAGDWPTVFWFRTPLALLVLVLSAWLPEPRVPRHGAPRFDILGAWWLTAALGGLIGFITLCRAPGAGWAACVLAGAAWLGCCAAFVAHEARFVQPILHIRHLRNPSFSGLQAVAIAQNFCGFSIFLLLPYVLDRHLALDAPAIGATLAISPAGGVLAGLAGARAASRWPTRHCMSAGLALSAAGLLAIATVMPWQSVPALAIGLAATGVGIGLFQIGYMDQTTATLPAAERGVSGSLVNVTRVVGAVIGAALITWLFEAWRAHHPELAAMRWSFASLGLLLLAVTGIVAAGVIDPAAGRPDAPRRA